jgi:hypothetical protein
MVAPHAQHPRNGGGWDWNNSHHEATDGFRQFGLAHVALSRLFLAGVLLVPIHELAESLGLDVEQSTYEGRPLRIAYFEREAKAFALVHHGEAPANQTELHTYIEQTPGRSDYRGRDELAAFMTLARRSSSEVFFPADFSAD